MANLWLLLWFGPRISYLSNKYPIITSCPLNFWHLRVKSNNLIIIIIHRAFVFSTHYWEQQFCEKGLCPPLLPVYLIRVPCVTKKLLKVVVLAHVSQILIPTTLVEAFVFHSLMPNAFQVLSILTRNVSITFTNHYQFWTYNVVNSHSSINPFY